MLSGDNWTSHAGADLLRTELTNLRSPATDALCAVSGAGGSSGLGRPAFAGYRVRLRPAVAEIIGAGLEWTVLMISELSMPWR